MKHILLLFSLLLPTFIQAQMNREFEAEYKKGYLCLTHIAKKNETLQDLARSYFLKNEVLSNVNNINANVSLKENQPVMIPLLETNYFKMAGITAGQNGFYPIYYRCASIDSIESICYKFMLQKSIFMKWNHLNIENQLKEGDKVMVGWLKYGVQASNSNSLATNSNLGQHVVTTKSTTPSGRKTSSVNANNTSNKNTGIVTTSQSNIPAKQVAASENKTTVSGDENGFNSVVHKIKTSLQPKEKNKASESTNEVSKPELNKAIVSKNKESNNEVEPTIKTSKKKKSLKEIWSQLVNGKEVASSETTTPKPVTQPVQKSVVATTKTSTAAGNTPKITKTTSPATVSKPSGPVVKKIPPQVKLSNSNVQKEVNKTPVQPVTTKAPVTTTGKSEYDLPNAEKVAEKKNNTVITETKITETKKEIRTETNATKPVSEAIPALSKSEVQVVKKPIQPVVQTKPVSSTPTVIPQKKTGELANPGTVVKESGSKTANSKSDVAKIEINPAPTIEVVHSESKTDEIPAPKTIHNVARNLELSNSKAGKCSYFFSGPTSGQFYVFTNLSAKGEIIKVTNVQNNRSVMAEVIGALPSSDVTKGLLIKLSDNAKLPLGQKNNAFNVKVNY